MQGGCSIKRQEGTNLQEWIFVVIDYEVRFSTYLTYSKIPPKRVWSITGRWSVYEERNNTLDNPVYPPQDVQDEALNEIKSRMKIVLEWMS